MFSFLQKLRGAQGEKSAALRLILKISGMHCTSCALNIDGTLEDMPGVISATTSYAKGQVDVRFDAEKISEKEIRNTIMKLGYSTNE